MFNYIIYRTDGTKEHLERGEEHEMQLDELQRIVGGYIEAIPINSLKEWDGQSGILLYANEDGRTLALKANPHFHTDYLGNPVVGDVVAERLS